MVPIVLEVQTLKGHQPYHGRLLCSRGHLVRLKRLCDVGRRLLGCGAFARGGCVRARLRLGRDGLDLRCCDLHVSGLVLGGGGSWSRVAQGRENEEDERVGEMSGLHCELRYRDLSILLR